MEREAGTRPPIGAGHAQALARIGLQELRNAIFPDSNVVVRHNEYGLLGTKTPGEVAQERESSEREQSHDQEPMSSLDGYVARAEQTQEHAVRERTAPEIERD